jgi:hypothetical protein
MVLGFHDLGFRALGCTNLRFHDLWFKIIGFRVLGIKDLRFHV